MIGPSYYDLVMAREQATYMAWARSRLGTDESAALWEESMRLWYLGRALGQTWYDQLTPVRYSAHLLG